MSDGAHLGVNPTRALETILGGAPSPSPEEQMTIEQYKTKLLDSPLPDKMDASYDGQTWAMAHAFYLEVLADPLVLTTNRDLHSDDYGYEPKRGQPKELPDCLYDRLFREEVPNASGLKFEDTYGATGFMVGFATNIAMHVLGLPPQQNPAIVELGRQ